MDTLIGVFLGAMLGSFRSVLYLVAALACGLLIPRGLRLAGVAFSAGAAVSLASLLWITRGSGVGALGLTPAQISAVVLGSACGTALTALVVAIGKDIFRSASRRAKT
ncbi:hypothetical protein [Pseudooceanicola sp. LIPI14-2-Ac024]|uniref:hypothetical protein n=1 Tax=Pseudooceanicola sp. LIPI14-2-Ac024 TaxID=3344875 RepID=UPI0035CF3D47